MHISQEKLRLLDFYKNIFWTSLLNKLQCVHLSVEIWITRVCRIAQSDSWTTFYRSVTDFTDFIEGPLEGLSHAHTVVVDLSIVRCQSCGYISKTKQDRPIVTMEHCWKVGISASVAAFRSSPGAPWTGATAPFSRKHRNIEKYWLTLCVWVGAAGGPAFYRSDDILIYFSANNH